MAENGGGDGNVGGFNLEFDKSSKCLSVVKMS